jgi:hypothetical protein
MSNCDFVAGRSLIDLAASRVALCTTTPDAAFSPEFPLSKAQGATLTKAATYLRLMRPELGQESAMSVQATPVQLSAQRKDNVLATRPPLFTSLWVRSGRCSLLHLPN